jgi:NTE family protein
MEPEAPAAGKARKRWGLVLMGGGARGLAHVGVLRVLEKNGLVPDIIAGTSMGGIVGGLYAAGLTPDDLEGMIKGRQPRRGTSGTARPARSSGLKLFKRSTNLFEYLLLSDTKNRLFKALTPGKKDTIEAYLRRCVGDVRIEDLPIKFVCNAVDLVTGQEVFFTSGRLAKALRATMSLPLVFAPARVGGMVLLDGGVYDSAPVDAARQLGAEVAVLVDIHKPLRRLPAKRIRNSFQVLQRLVEIAKAGMDEPHGRQADIVLRVPLDVEILDFSDPMTIVRKGERTAAAGLERIRAALA